MYVCDISHRIVTEPLSVCICHPLSWLKYTCDAILKSEATESSKANHKTVLLWKECVLKHSLEELEVSIIHKCDNVTYEFLSIYFSVCK